jgi:hypothetical protein
MAFYLSGVAGESNVTAVYVVFLCLTSFRKLRALYPIALPYFAPSSGFLIEFGRVTSGGKMYGQRSH